MRNENVLLRLLFLLPVILAVGVWAGHQTLASDLLEHHPDYPIELSTVIAPVPETPAPVVTLAPRPVIILPIVEEVTALPDPPQFLSGDPRGPPAAIHRIS